MGRDDCWTYEDAECRSDGACKLCNDSKLTPCHPIDQVVKIIKDDTMATCENGSSSPVGAILGFLIPLLLIGGVWAYWVYVLNGKFCVPPKPVMWQGRSIALRRVILCVCTVTYSVQ